MRAFFYVLRLWTPEGQLKWQPHPNYPGMPVKMCVSLPCTKRKLGIIRTVTLSLSLSLKNKNKKQLFFLQFFLLRRGDSVYISLSSISAWLCALFFPHFIVRSFISGHWTFNIWFPFSFSLRVFTLCLCHSWYCKTFRINIPPLPNTPSFRSLNHSYHTYITLSSWSRLPPNNNKKRNILNSNNNKFSKCPQHREICLLAFRVFAETLFLRYRPP